MKPLEKDKKADHEKVKARDFLLNYAKSKGYNINEDDIGWYKNDSTRTGLVEGAENDPNNSVNYGMITLGGSDLLKPSYIQDNEGVENDHAFANRNNLMAAVDRYAKERGLDLNSLSQAPEQRQAPQTAPAPEFEDYKSPYSSEINDLLEQVMEMKKFQYDPNNDPAFQAYSEAYKSAGDDAMQNVLGAATGTTGGQLNSWAVASAGQAKNQYNERLMSNVPGFQQAALSAHQAQANNKLSTLNTLSGLENQAYNQYSDNRNFKRGVYESDRGYERGVYESDRSYDRGAFESDRAHGFNVDRANTQDDQWQQSFDQAQDQWQKTFDQAQDHWQKTFDQDEDQWQKMFDQNAQFHADDVKLAWARINATRSNASAPKDAQIPVLYGMMTQGVDSEGNVISESPEEWIDKQLAANEISNYEAGILANWASYKRDVESTNNPEPEPPSYGELQNLMLKQVVPYPTGDEQVESIDEWFTIMRPYIDDSTLKALESRYKYLMQSGAVEPTDPDYYENLNIMNMK